MTFAMPISGLLHQVWPLAEVQRTSDSKLVAEIRERSAELRGHSDDQLAKGISELRAKQQTPAAIDERATLVASCGIACEAVRRVLGVELYDSQLRGGLALARGAIAEMESGEGKTFTTILPATLFALPGDGVHVMTINAYLAKRDYQLLKPVYALLGYSVGLIESDVNVAAKRAAYACDITYGAGSEFGFDYLRDQAARLSQPKPKLIDGYRLQLRAESTAKPASIQRGHAAAIVDEADSVMIDEATTPLVLALGGGTAADNAKAYIVANQIVSELKADEDFLIDESKRTVQLTDVAERRLATLPASLETLQLDRPWVCYLEQALRANHLFQANVHYVVREGVIQIVDQKTGRVYKDRTWRDGLHQAVQAAEGVAITAESKSLVRISRQRFFQRYGRLGGLTGSAMSAVDEFRSTYGIEVSVIEPNRRCRRKVMPTRIYLDASQKELAIADEVVRIHQSRRPILIGTTSIAVNERIAQLLTERGVEHQCLHGKQDANEADLIAKAGQVGAVTLATNMAGRGVDIPLGEGVAELGGLHVIATEPQYTNRVDHQLFGRAARRGDPGSCQRFTSPEDALFADQRRMFNAKERQSATAAGEVFPVRSIDNEIARIQKRAEQANAARRSRLFVHDDWLEGVVREGT